MKLLILSAIFPPHIIGGAEMCAFDVARHFARRGHEVSVMTLAEPDEADAWNEPTEHGFRLFRVRSPRAHTLFQHAGSAVIQRPLWHFQDNFDVRNKSILGRVLDEVKPDHVQIHVLTGLGFNALEELGRRRLSVTYVLHDLGLACVKTTMFRSGHSCESQCGSCRILSTVKNRMVRSVPGIRFVSPSQANLDTVSQFVPAVGGAESRVIRNLPSDSVKPLPYRALNSNKVRLLYAGRLHPTKGINVMLDALAPLADEFDFQVTVMGRSDDGGDLQARYDRLPWITFAGFVPMDAVLAQMAQSELVCVPSLWRENYSRTVIDALSLGTPVIGSDIGGIPEQVEHGKTGMLVPPDNVQAWRSAFRRIFSEPDLLRQWRYTASQRVAQASVDEILDAYEDFMQPAVRA